MRRTLTTALLCLLTAAATARAELLEFRAGGRVRFPATVEGESVTISAPSGPLRFRRTDFRTIAPDQAPETEWPSRESAARQAGASERFAAAWWALENGLIPEAEAMLRSAHEADAAFEPVRRLIPLLDALSQPLPEPNLASFARILPGRAQVTRSEHVILFHQHPEPLARSRVETLERVFRAFYLMFAAQGLELRLPTQKLVSVWFAEKGAYRAYLKGEGATQFLTTRGYYHPTRGFVLAYDPRSDPARRQSASRLASRRREWDGLERILTALPPGESFTLAPRFEASRKVTRDEGLQIVADHKRDFARQELLWELEALSLDLGTASHELVHQLVAESRLAPHPAAFPFWLQEGLAMQFEVIRDGRWAGISRINPLRLSDFRKIAPAPHLSPLVRDRGFGHGYRDDLYAEAWSLVYFLRKQHPDLFVAWLTQLRQSPATGPAIASDRSAKLFATTFRAELPQLESAWHAYLSALQAPPEPAESFEPAPGSAQSD